jgi:hypothetical protein
MVMSKIFDSIRQADLAVAERKHSETPATNATKKSDHRRTPRVRAQISLLVYGYSPQGTPFIEEAYTIEINAHGALIAMKSAVLPSDRLLLTNTTNERTQECTVRTVIARPGRDVEVAIAFATPAPQFWRKSKQKRS